MNIINQLLAGTNLFRLNFQMCNNKNLNPTLNDKQDQLNLLQNTLFSNMLIATQIQNLDKYSNQQQVPVVTKSKKISKRDNNCGHPEREHYAKGMCSNCYHKYGRTKKPWICGHQKLYAQGLCQNCYNRFYVNLILYSNIIMLYINQYNQKRREAWVDNDKPKLEEQKQQI